MFRQLRETFWEEYTMFELWTLVPALVSPVMTRFLADWDPLADPQHVIEMLHKWKPVSPMPRNSSSTAIPVSNQGTKLCGLCKRKKS